MNYDARLAWLVPCAGLLMACTGNIDSISLANQSGQTDSPGSDSPAGSTNEGTGSEGSAPTTGSAGGGNTTGGSSTATGSTAPEPSAAAVASVKVELTKVRSSSVVSFSLPVAKGRLASAASVQVLAGSTPLNAKVRELLTHYDATGKALGVAALQVQFPAASMPSNKLSVEVRWSGGKSVNTGLVAYAQVSAQAPATTKTAVRTIASSGGQYRLTESAATTKVLFTAREPNVFVSFPDGYLAATDVLGMQMSAAQVARTGTNASKFLSDNFNGFGLSSIYADGYAYHPDPTSVADLEADYSAWLYDRCATYLTAFSHFADQRFAQFGFKTCAYFADHIGLSGTALGIFSGKASPDMKYSHAKGLYAYYSLTGDEAAKSAGVAIADMWLNDATFVQPYRAGKLRGPDKLWTERLLATSLEGLLYGYRFTGDTKYLIAFEEMVDTAFKHITGSAAELAALNPGATFPPQNCFIHSGLQQSEATAGEPWCSPWMSELVVDSLLAYQALTNDTRVDEIFIRLGRFLRDVGTAYFTTDPVNDTFMKPTTCDDPNADTERRRLVPLYGAGLTASGARVNKGEWTDFEHCADASALSAAALRALKRTGQYDKRPVGPFKSEGESFLQLHHELLSCAQRTFEEETRPKRHPSSWTSAELASGASNPAGFILSNKIGFPSHMQEPTRKLSWWFNTSIQQFKMLEEVGIRITALRPGAVQPTGCK